MGLLANYDWQGIKNYILGILFDGKFEWDGNTYTTLEDNGGAWTHWSKGKTNEIRDLINKYGYTRSQVEDILEAYKPDSYFQSAFIEDIPTELLADLQDMDKWESYIGDAPKLPDPNQYYQEAQNEIDAEISELNNIYDKILGQQTSNMEQELQDNANMFSDYRNQVLTNNAMQQQAIAGATRYELNRQQRNAITRGASAAQRLVANINTQLGMQAKAAQQSLDTSNALAQQLLLHRQANAQLRSDYRNAQTDDALRRASLINGRSERILSHQTNRLGQAMDAYDLQMQDYNNRRSNVSGTNPWSSAWTSYYTKKQQDSQGKPSY